MEKPIGGYFELELPLKEEFHKNALRLNSGKNCLEYILRARKYDKVYIPYYTCDIVIKPFEKLEIPYEFYHVDIHMEINDDINLRKNEALLYTNYFGLKQRYVEQLAEEFGPHLIIDNTQAFFAKPLDGIDTFYTCRKFFGVADGAYLYTDAKSEMQLEQSTSYEHTSHLIKRIDVSPEAGFQDFHESDKALANEDIKLMSRFTQRIMQSINYGEVACRRRGNYQRLNEILGEINNLKITLEEDAVPMAYPYLSTVKYLRNKLIENNIFVARYWPNVMEWTGKDDIEYRLASQMQSLPIDQRYDANDMKRIIEILQGNGKYCNI